MSNLKKKRKIGTLSSDERSLILRFRQSQERNRMLWSLDGVYFDAAIRQWRVPVYEFSRVMHSRVFSPEALHYELDTEAILERSLSERAKYQRAWECIRKNPFEVSEEHIQDSSVPVVLRLDTSMTLVLIHCMPWLRKRKERQEKLLRSYPALFDYPEEKALGIPVSELTPLLRWFRDEGISFAVAADSGKALRESAPHRSTLFEDANHACAKDFKKALLSPILYQDRDVYCLDTNIPHYLRKLFPTLSLREARKKAISLEENELEALIWSALREQVIFWCEESIITCIKEKQSAAILLSLLSHDAFVFDAHPKHGISLYAADSSPVPGIAGCQRSGFLLQYGLVRYAVPDTALQEVLITLGGQQVLMTDAYCEYRDILHERRKLFEERMMFEAMHDTSCGLKNATLEARLFPHQRVAVSWLLAREHSMLGDDMGLGKTLSVLTSFEELYQREEVSFLLILCPNSLVLNWQREAEAWLDDCSLAILPESKKERIVFLDSLIAGRVKGRGLVLNYEAARLPYVTDALVQLCASQDVMLCCDESQRVKNARSKTFQAVAAIRACVLRSVLLSGTPAPKDISDLWSQVYLVDRGLRFGRKYFEWLQEIAELGTRYSPYAVKRFLPDKVDAVIAATREVLLRRKKEDVLSLPEKTFMTRDVSLSGEQKKRYEEVREELLLRMTGSSGKEFQRAIDNVLEQYLRAVQIASNPRLVDPSYEGDPAKFTEIDALVHELVEEQGEKLVIWTNYRLNVSELVDRYRHLGAEAFTGDTSRDERERIVRSFQECPDETKIIVAIPSAGGVGITLTAAQTAVYLDKTWNAEHWMQSIDRIHRIGQRGSVRIISLHACNVDSLISRNLSRKMLLQQKICGDDGSVLESLLPNREELLEAVRSL